MGWLRLDDGFTEHRKLLLLDRKDRWTWLELLTYVARQNDNGHVPRGVADVLRHVTPKFLQDCIRVGLLDASEDGFYVHDWDEYNPPDKNAERQRKYRARIKAEQERNVTRDVTGNATGDVTRDVTRDVTVTPPVPSLPKPVVQELSSNSLRSVATAASEMQTGNATLLEEAS